MSIEYLSEVIADRKWNAQEREYPVDRIVKHIGRRLARQMNRSLSGETEKIRDPALTRLQKKALNDPLFWGEWNDENEFSGRNLVIQGATSSGKTLLSELLSVDMLDHHKSVIVLVPLKSMVRERYRRFERDFRVGGIDRVYPSSSDYLDHDEAILNGDYNIAVMVYEKFFAMLCQSEAREGLMKHCGLAIVDELSMLGDRDRGPKLEIAVSKAMELPNPPRLVCLATTECDTSKVEQWLSIGGERAWNIRENSRPVGLDEYVVRDNGRYRMKHLPGEGEDFHQGSRAGTMPVTLLRDREVKERRNAVLKTILQKLYPPVDPENLAEAGPRPKTLIFVPSQGGTIQVAKMIKGMVDQNLLSLDPFQEKPTLEEDQQRLEELQRHLPYCDPDEDLKEIEEMLEKKIVYHYGPMSTGLRETVEELFSIDPSVKIIVATSTLTIGVNLPLDVVILYSTAVSDGSGTRVPITMQEYMNFIGRAGRLGLSRYKAESYLIAVNTEETSYWYRENTKDKPIQSALMGVKEKELIPYYMNLLSSGEIDETRVKRIYDKSLTHLCAPDQTIQADKMLQILEDENLADGEPELELNYIGRVFAAYALSVSTMKNLRKVFVVPGGKNASKGLMGSGTIDKEIDADVYLPDILFSICMNEEIRENRSLSIISILEPSNRPENRVSIIRLLLAREEEMMEGKLPNGRQISARKYWKGSMLKKYMESDASPKDTHYNAIYRTLLLYYWTQGYSASDIRKHMNHPDIRFSNGDLERMAEVVSFQLEAVCNIVGERWDMLMGKIPLNLVGAFRRLSKRVKYGVPSELVLIANRHVHGLNRNSILLVGRAAKEKGKTPLEYLRTVDADELLRKTHIIPSRLELLLQRLQSRFSSRRDMEAKLRELSATSGFISRWNQLREYHGDAAEMFALLTNLLQEHTVEESGNSKVDYFCSCKDLEKVSDNSKYWCFMYNCRQRTPHLILTFCHVDETGRESDSNWTIPNTDDIHVAVFDSFRCPSVETVRERCGEKFPNLCITCSNLADLIASSVLLEESAAATALYTGLSDSRGQINGLTLNWNNYQKTEDNIGWEKASFQLLMDSSEEMDEDVEQGLMASKDLKQFFKIPWGMELDEQKKELLKSKPLIILLGREKIRASSSLMSILVYLDSENWHENVLILAKENNDILNWATAASNENGLRWPGFNRFSVVWNQTAEEKVDMIRKFVEMCQARAARKKQEKVFRIGISYPHYDEFGALITAEDCRFNTDLTNLRALGQKINEYFGEENVLYDRNTQAEMLFLGKQEKALSAYSTCEVGVCLCNAWGCLKSWCEKERAALRKGGADLIYLCTASTPAEVDGNPAGKLSMVPLPTDQAGREALLAQIQRQLTDRIILWEGREDNGQR